MNRAWALLSRRLQMNRKMRLNAVVERSTGSEALGTEVITQGVVKLKPWSTTIFEV